MLNASQITLLAAHQQNTGLILWAAGLVATRRFTEGADATLVYIGRRQNILLGKHGFLDIGIVYILHHKTLEQRRWEFRWYALGP